MDQHTVTSSEGMVAAVKASAQQTYEEARKHPFEIECGTTKFTFKEGVTDRRADTIVANLRRVSKRYFEVR